MMVTTHALAGVVLGLVAGAVSPAAGPVVVVAAMAGGLFPDLDVVTVHRQTLHYPVYYSLAASGGLVAAGIVSSTQLLAVALFFTSAAVHSLMDVLGGGLSLRPWEATSNRAVYEHLRERWHTPRRLIPYDGSPADLMLAVLFGLPGLVFLTGRLRVIVGGLLGVSVIYALVRKRLVSFGIWVVDNLPPWLLRLVPEPLIEDLR